MTYNNHSATVTVHVISELLDELINPHTLYISIKLTTLAIIVNTEDVHDR